MTTKRMASYPANLTPLSMFKPMPNPTKQDQLGPDLSVTSIQRALDQLLAEFHHKNCNKVRHFNTSSTGNNHRNVSNNRPRMNSYSKQIQARAVDSPNHSWWFPPPGSSSKQAFYAPKTTPAGSNRSNPLLMLPSAPVSRYSLFQSLPPVSKPSKVTKIPKISDCPLTLPLLDRTVAPPKAQTGFQPFNMKPTSSFDETDGSTSDDSCKDLKKLPLYMRSASPKFQLIVPEVRRPITRSRSQSGRSTPSKEEHDLVIKIVNGTVDEIQKIIEDFMYGKAGDNQILMDDD